MGSIMTVYRFQPRAQSILTSLVMAGLGIGIFCLVGVPLIGEGSSGPGDGFRTLRFTLTAICCAPFLFFSWGSLRQVHELRLAEDGAIEFRRAAGSTWITARDVRSLEGMYFGSYDGDAYWQFRIRHTRGHFSFGEVDDALDFVDRIALLNPEVRITGAWPMTMPPVSPTRVAR
jgi:hypothetical protein